MSYSFAAATTIPEQPAAMWAQMRLADSLDVPHIHRLIRQMAEFKKLTHLFSATELSLSTTLFHPSTLPLLHRPHPRAMSKSLLPSWRGAQRCSGSLSIPHNRPAVGAEVPSGGPKGGRVHVASRRRSMVVGFVLCFPNYSTFLAKPGLYVEDIFVRAAWRHRGFGRMILSAVAAQAAKMGTGRVEWCVLDLNANAISFYEEMGAEVPPQWQICRLTLRAMGLR